MGLSAGLKEHAAPVWQAFLEHPMVRGIGDGSLDSAPFQYWVRQDYLYLIDYARTFALAAAKAPDLEEMGRFATLLTETIHTEMDLHREYAESIGIPREQLERTEASPTTRAYTDFLVRTGAVGTFADTVAVILPCMWGFNDTGINLKKQGLPEEAAYRSWIEMYSGDEFTRLTQDCIRLMDATAHDASEADKARYQDLFLTSARYELLFWEAAWRQETWPA